MFSSVQKNYGRSCTHIVKMCSIYSGKLKIRVFSHNFDINIIFIAIHDGQGEEVQTFRRGFECVSDAIPAVTMVTDYLVKLHLPN